MYLKLSKNQVKYYSQLQKKKYRKERKEYIIEGIKICEEALSSIPDDIKLIFFNKDLLSNKRGTDILEKAHEKEIPIFEIEEKDLNKITDTKNPQPIVGIVKIKNEKINKEFFIKNNRFLILLNISDPGNLGTLIRTAEAFKWNNIILAGNCVELYNPKVVRATMGSLFRVNIRIINRIDELVSFLEDTNIHYFITNSKKGQVPPYNNLPKRLALILGNESQGIPEYLENKASQILRLPLSKKVDSLNVSVAGGIFLYILSNNF